jgi:hypothetical protein
MPLLTSNTMGYLFGVHNANVNMWHCWSSACTRLAGWVHSQAWIGTCGLAPMYDVPYVKRLMHVKRLLLTKSRLLIVKR